MSITTQVDDEPIVGGREARGNPREPHRRSRNGNTHMPSPVSGRHVPGEPTETRLRRSHAQQAPSPQPARSGPENETPRPGVARLVAQAVEQGLPLVVSEATTLRAVASLIRRRGKAS